jgi:nitrogen regulatory protein PII
MSSLVVLILHDLRRFEEVLAAWHDAGAASTTILDALGTRDPREQARREDLPLLPSIRDLLHADDAPRRMIFSIVRDELVDPLVRATERVLGDLAEEGNGLLFVLPVARTVGVRGQEGGG